MNQKKKKQPKKPRGRPVKNIIEPIDATPEEVAKAMFLLANRKMREGLKIKK